MKTPFEKNDKENLRDFKEIAELLNMKEREVRYLYSSALKKIKSPSNFHILQHFVGYNYDSEAETLEKYQELVIN